jgi:hypothetical protein
MDGLGGMINKLSLAFGISFGKRHNQCRSYIAWFWGLSAIAFSSIDVNIHVLTL